MTGAPWSGWMPDWASVDTSSMTLLVGWESASKEAHVRRLPIARPVAQALAGPVNATADRLRAASPVRYSPDLELDGHQYAVVAREELDPDGTLLTRLEALTPAEAVDADMKRSLLFYALAVGPAAGRIIFIRRANPRAHLSRKFFALFGDELSAVRRPLLSFDLSLIDLVLVAGNGLAVLNLKAYERLFRDSPELLARTPAKVAELHKVLPLTRGAQAALADTAQRNTRVRTRLLATLSRGHLEHVSLPVLEAEMKRQGLDPARHLVNGELDFTADEAMAIMQLLNEDLTIGGLSSKRFIINKKSPRT